ncbi:MAG: RNA polymerase sigma factor [Planctomycetota bacterium]|nr:MAG: RNA polymerase sigma factor [Planctomycetota bacterium]
MSELCVLTMCKSDTEYIKQCLNGDSDAYRYLVRNYHDIVVANLVSQLRDIERAEDVAQETFVRAFFRLHKLQKTQSFLPWLMGITYRVIKERQREEERRHSLALRSAENKFASQSSRDMDEELEQYIARLPDIYREVILLRFYGGRTCQQIADKLKISTGTVTSRLSRAYAILKDRMDQCIS